MQKKGLMPDISIMNKEESTKQFTFQLDDYRFVESSLVIDGKTIKLKLRRDILTVEFPPQIRLSIQGKIKRKGFLGGIFKTIIENDSPTVICD
jgi:hypothetical protein